MQKLNLSLDDCGSELFAQNLKREIENLPADVLLLDRATTQGGYVDGSDLSTTILSISSSADLVLARIGVFFTEVVGGCSCGDEPVSNNVYCELQVSIDKATSNARFSLIAD